jgi:uncharacterized protein YbjT (DUF2867 family)
VDHAGKVYELTGPRSHDMHSLAAEYSTALGRAITYLDVPFEQRRDQEVKDRPLPDHLFQHLLITNRYHRPTHDVGAITGRPPTGVRDFVTRHAESFTG